MLSHHPESSSKKPLSLSKEAKRNNHLESEKKRRNNIKHGFELISDAIPSLKEGNLSEAQMLQATAEHITQLISENKKLEAEVNSLLTLMEEK